MSVVDPIAPVRPGAGGGVGVGVEFAATWADLPDPLTGEEDSLALLLEAGEGLRLRSRWWMPMALDGWEPIPDWHMLLADDLATLTGRGVFAVDVAGSGSVTKTAGGPLVIHGAHDGANRATLKSIVDPGYKRLLLVMRYRITAGTNQPMVYASSTDVRYACTLLGGPTNERLKTADFNGNPTGDEVSVDTGRTVATALNCQMGGTQTHWSGKLAAEGERVSSAWGYAGGNYSGGGVNRLWFLGGVLDATVQLEIDAFQVFGRS